jgi:hypothetical protein
LKYIVFLIFTLILSSCSFESENDDLGDNFFSGNKPSENLIIFTPPAGKTYIAGEQIIFSITHPGILTVTGTPRLSIDIGGNSVFADYQNGSGTKTLTFSYTVLANDLDADGIEVLSSLDLNGGSITFDNKGVVTNTETNFNEGGFLNLVKVDAVVPTLTSIIPVALPTSTLYVGQSIEMAASFSENILITGSPTIDIDINDKKFSICFRKWVFTFVF